MTPPILFEISRLLEMAVLAVIAFILLARNGYSLLSFFCNLPGGARTKYSAGFLAGLITFGLGIVSLALTGLLYPSLVLVLLAALALPSRLPLPAFIPASPRISRTGMIAVAITVPVISLVALTPITDIDAFVYGLASGWQFLQAHRVLFADVPMGFLIPLPVEMAFLPALIFGDDRLTTCLSLASFAAAGIIFLDLRKPRISWLGPAMALAGGGMLSYIACGKNDVVTSAFFVAGALLMESGSRYAGAFLLGACVAAKPVFAPLVLVWWIYLHPRNLRQFVVETALLMAPIFPWWVKSFLAIGNPFYPFGTGIIATFNCGPASLGKFMDQWKPMWFAGSGSWWTIPGPFIEGFAGNNLLVAIAIPGLLLFDSGKRIRLAVLLFAELVMLRYGHVTRYWMPSAWLMAFYVSETFSGGGPRISRWLVPVAGVWTLSAVLLHPVIREFPFGNELRIGRSGSAVNGPYDEACRMVVQAGAKRVLTVGEMRSYLLPARAVRDGIIGETPLTWKITRESWTPDDAVRKLKQAGIGLLLYNYVSPQYEAYSAGKWFPWDRRMGKLWETLVRTRLEIKAATSTCDFVWGGYYLYRIRGAAHHPGDLRVFYLPGAEGLTAVARLKRRNGDNAGSILEYQRLCAEYPAVLSFQCELGDACMLLGRDREAVALLKPAVESGIMHPSIPFYGIALFKLKEYAGARAELRASQHRYLANGRETRLCLAGSCINLAKEKSLMGRYDESEMLLREAEGAVAARAGDRSPESRLMARAIQAWVTAVRAGIEAAQGRCEKAAVMYREAAEMVPGYSGAREWLKLAGEPCGKD